MERSQSRLPAFITGALGRTENLTGGARTATQHDRPQGAVKGSRWVRTPVGPNKGHSQSEESELASAPDRHVATGDAELP